MTYAGMAPQVRRPAPAAPSAVAVAAD